MKKRVLALVSYAVFWLIFFVFARLFFIFTHFGEASQFSTGTILATFLHGIKLDISAISYIMSIPMLVLIPGVYFAGNWYRHFIKWYSYLIIVISSIIIVADTFIYRYWGYRLDYSALQYLNTPKEVLASVNTLQLSIIILVVILIAGGFILLYNRFISRFFDNLDRVRLWPVAMIIFTILFASLIIPVRGGVGIAPINAGSVYFSEHIFVNHTSINVVWNAGSSYINRKPSANPYNYGDLQEAKEIVETLTADNEIPVKLLNCNRPNIILFVLESFGSTLIGPLGGDSFTTPCFNRYTGEGILFTNFFASGNRTDKAMPAILNGYPSQPVVSIMKEPKKTQSLPGLVKTLNEQGYNSSFWYGGEINFANFNSFVINSGFDQIITMDNFSPEHYNSKWGVHDHVLINALTDSMKNVREPFLKVVLTLSSHEPFEVPVDPAFEGRDDMTKFRNSVYYTDSTIGAFLDDAKNTGWWDNTLIILVADHCRRSSLEILAYSEEIFRIPMLWVGGALENGNIKIEKLGTQVDIPVTILHQLDLDGNYPFAKDLLSGGSSSFAFYTFNEGFTFITDTSKYVYDHKLGAPVVEEGSHPGEAGRIGKAYLQVVYDDFMKR
jgi:phosphoglycerol transferase MdoB-like AlkP superfamily enzyme